VFASGQAVCVAGICTVWGGPLGVSLEAPAAVGVLLPSEPEDGKEQALTMTSKKQKKIIQDDKRKRFTIALTILSETTADKTGIRRRTTGVSSVSGYPGLAL